MGAGKIDPSGKVVQSPDDVVAGAAVPAWKVISLGKRFLFASDPDVHLYINLDTSAISKDTKLNLLFGGAAVGLEGKTSDGTPLKLRFGAGRDSAGGPGGFFTIQIGPDPTQMPSSP